MKKILTLLLMALFICFLPTAFAADYAQDATTGVVTIEATDGTDAPVDMTFSPSNQIIMTGASDATAFAHAAYHPAVEDRDAGKQFAMASDANVVLFLDITTDGQAPQDLAGDTNVADIHATSAGNWHTM